MMKAGIVAGIIRTAVLLIVFSLIFATIGSLVGWFFGNWPLGLMIMLALSLLLSLYSIIFSKRSALRAYHVHLVTEAQEPRLYRIVRSIADRAGLPMPEVGVCEDSMPNAFATGRSPRDAAVVATRGILRTLDDDELEAVFAHEMSHVLHRDILVMGIASTMASVLSYITTYGGLVLMSSSSNRKEGGLALFIIGLLMYVLVPFASLAIQLGISRSREYMADEGAAYITGKPLELARALRHIEGGIYQEKVYMERVGEETAEDRARSDMMIVNPLTMSARGRKSSIFSTHPSTEDRISRLEALDRKFKAEGYRPR